MKDVMKEVTKKKIALGSAPLATAAPPPRPYRGGSAPAAPASHRPSETSAAAIPYGKKAHPTP